MTPEDIKLAKKTLREWKGSWDWLNAGPLKLAVNETPFPRLRPNMDMPLEPLTFLQFSYQGMLAKDPLGRPDFIIVCNGVEVYREPYGE